MHKIIDSYIYNISFPYRYVKLQHSLQDTIPVFLASVLTETVSGKTHDKGYEKLRRDVLN